MNYQETIDYLFSRLPMFSRTGAAALKPDLENIKKLCGFLGNPEKNFKSIHIAGTNGKGSTSHMLAAIMQKSGYKTGLYTSPHLKDFRERIRVNGEMIPEDEVVAFTKDIRHLIEDIFPSFFEITVAMAFRYFAQQQVDIAVIEVGLGGRFDSTNIIIPQISVITNIGMDHMNILGNTIGAIAKEKAGIIKPGIPVVIGEASPELKEIFDSVARMNGAPVHFAQKARYAAEFIHKNSMLEVTVVNTHSDERNVFKLDLPGVYQVKNLITVLATVMVLNEGSWKIPDSCIHEALQQVKKLTGLKGRWEVVHHHPTVVLDVGHNEDGIRQIAAQLELMDYHELHIVIGMVRDKDITAVLSLLPKEATYYFTRAQIPRAFPEQELQEAGLQNGLKGGAFENVHAAVMAAFQQAGPNDLLLVCGSVYIVSEVNEGIFI